MSKNKYLVGVLSPNEDGTLVVEEVVTRERAHELVDAGICAWMSDRQHIELLPEGEEVAS